MVSYHLAPTRIAIRGKKKKNVEKLEPLCTFWLECKVVQPLCIAVPQNNMVVSQEVENSIIIWYSNTIVGIYPK